MKDPIVSEIRKARRDIENECVAAGQDFSFHVKSLQKQYSDRLVARSPKKSLRVRIA